MTSAAGGPPLLDEVEVADAQASDGAQVTARRRIPQDEPFFGGHFPAMPVVPGVFMVEALAECARQFLSARYPDAGSRWVLASVPRVRFRRRVAPGDTLDLNVRYLGPVASPVGTDQTQNELHRFDAVASSEDQQAVQAVLELGPASCAPDAESA